MGYAEWKGTPRPGEKTGGQRETPNSWRETASGKLDRKTSTLARYWLSTRAGRIPSHGGRPRDDDGEAASILRGGVSAQLRKVPPAPAPETGLGPRRQRGWWTRSVTFPLLRFIYMQGRETELGVFHSWFLPLMPTTAGAETPPGPPKLEPSLLPPKVCVSRKLEPEPEPGLEHLP